MKEPESQHRPRLAVFATRYPPLAGSESIVAERTVELLAGLGIDCTIYTADLARPAKGDSHSRMASRLEPVKLLSYYMRRLQLMRRMGTPILLSSAYVVKALRAFYDDHRASPYDAIMSRNNDYSPHLVGLRAKRLTRLPWIVSVNDPFPKTLVPPEYQPAETWKQRIKRHAWTRVAQKVYSDADAVVFSAERLRRVTEARYPMMRADGSAKAFVVPHVGRSEPCGKQYRSSHGWQVLHVGTLDSTRNPVALLRAWRRFASRDDVAHPVLTFVGNVHPLHCATMADALDTMKACVEWIPQVDPRTSLELMAGADVLVLIEGPLAEGVFLPLKFCDYAVSGRPILALSPRVGTVSDYMRMYGCGLRCDMNDERQIYAALSAAFDNWRRGLLRGSARLASCFRAENVGSKWSEVLRGVGLFACGRPRLDRNAIQRVATGAQPLVVRCL